MKKIKSKRHEKTKVGQNGNEMAHKEVHAKVQKPLFTIMKNNICHMGPLAEDTYGHLRLLP